VAEVDDAFDDVRVAWVSVDAGDEAAVDFQLGYGESFQLGEAGVARAEVVDRDRDTEIFESD